MIIMNLRSSDVSPWWTQDVSMDISSGIMGLRKGCLKRRFYLKMRLISREYHLMIFLISESRSVLASIRSLYSNDQNDRQIGESHLSRDSHLERRNILKKSMRKARRFRWSIIRCLMTSGSTRCMEAQTSTLSWRTRLRQTSVKPSSN